MLVMYDPEFTKMKERKKLTYIHETLVYVYKLRISLNIIGIILTSLLLLASDGGLILGVIKFVEAIYNPADSGSVFGAIVGCLFIIAGVCTLTFMYIIFIICFKDCLHSHRKALKEIKELME